MKVRFYAPVLVIKTQHTRNTATRPGADRGEPVLDPESPAGYVKYASEMLGSHGLFGPEEEPRMQELLRESVHQVPGSCQVLIRIGSRPRPG